MGSRRRYGLAGSSAILTTPAFDGVIYLSVPNGGYAKAINNQNMIVGATGSNSTTDEYSHAYLYDLGTETFQDLGTLHGGLTSSATDINEFNQVVGTSWLVTQLTSLYDPTQYHAFFWQDGEMVDLISLIPADHGWILTAARAINDNGDIVGTGQLDGREHGFLLTKNPVPPPPTIEEPPIAVVSADVTSGKAPLTVNFSSVGSYDPDGGGITHYRWDFGDTLGTDLSADSTYVSTEPGTYIVTLTVTDDEGMTAEARLEIVARKSAGKGRR